MTGQDTSSRLEARDCRIERLRRLKRSLLRGIRRNELANGEHVVYRARHVANHNPPARQMPTDSQERQKSDAADKIEFSQIKHEATWIRLVQNLQNLVAERISLIGFANLRRSHRHHRDTIDDRCSGKFGDKLAHEIPISNNDARGRISQDQRNRTIVQHQVPDREVPPMSRQPVTVSNNCGNLPINCGVKGGYWNYSPFLALIAAPRSADYDGGIVRRECSISWFLVRFRLSSLSFANKRQITCVEGPRMIGHLAAETAFFAQGCAAQLFGTSP